jgi:hypothetical protein
MLSRKRSLSPESAQNSTTSKIYGTYQFSHPIRRLLHISLRRWLRPRKHESPQRDRKVSPLVDASPNPQGARGGMMTAEERHDAECQFTRNLLCGMVQQAVEDLRSEKVFVSKQMNAHQEIDRDTALHFIRSKAFQGICDVLSLPADKIKTKALKYESRD